MNVYLVHAEGTNRYKIGITARAIESRMKELHGEQSAYPLRLISYVRNANFKEVEQHLHERYELFRRHGEWFEFEPLQLAEVQNYLKTFDTPLSAIKPILKSNPKSGSVAKNTRLPSVVTNLLFKNWLPPALIGIGLVLAIHSLDFFKSPEVSPTKPVATVKAKTFAMPKLLRKNKRITGKIKIAH